MEDVVAHPAHYAETCVEFKKAECIDITRYLDFNLGNAVKYIWRAGKKDKDTALQDLKKAYWYLEDYLKNVAWQYSGMSPLPTLAPAVYRLIERQTLIKSIGEDLVYCLDCLLTERPYRSAVSAASAALERVILDLENPPVPLSVPAQKGVNDAD